MASLSIHHRNSTSGCESRFSHGFGDDPVTNKTLGLLGPKKLGKLGFSLSQSALCSSQSEIFGPRVYGMDGSRSKSSGSSSTAIFEMSKVP
ncbi:hypothetical protein RJ641_004250 [Dillenia turbinata]|uniref:Uncharacterized protein n=1 Tax=Dillenia turbinata TaxID=194707 RepID=A0AAN8VHR0_9MAGN